MDQFRFDSFCGNYCGACEIMSAYRNGAQDKVAAQWGASPDEIRCLGCKTETVFKKCTACKIRACASEKGVEHCVVCKDFPCDILKSGESLVAMLPHLKTIPLNMRTIKDKGAEFWLAEQSGRMAGNGSAEP